MIPGNSSFAAPALCAPTLMLAPIANGGSPVNLRYPLPPKVKTSGHESLPGILCDMLILPKACAFPYKASSYVLESSFQIYNFTGIA